MGNLISIEMAIAALGLLVCLPRLRVAERGGRRVWRLCRRLARPSAAAACGVGLFALALAVGVSLIRWPEPRVTDEFSYLLAADTFAHGRLANPPLPFSEHLSSRHVLARPTYQSKYPPAQGLALALGQATTGYPIAGVWLSMAFACAAVFWMIRGWLSPPWALLGGCIAAARLGALGGWRLGRYFYWSQSYWGGAVAMAGGALVFGALPRVLRGHRPRDAAVLGLGLVILASSRPYEGFVASLPAAAVLIADFFRQREVPLGRRLLRAGVPLLAVLGLGAAGLGYYHYRVTGSPFLMPYQVHDETTRSKSLFVLPDLIDDEDADPNGALQAAAPRPAARPGSPKWFWRAIERRFPENWNFYFGPALAVPVLLLPLTRRHRLTRLAVVACLSVAAANLVIPAGFPHYSAPVAPCFIALGVVGLRRLYLWRPRGRLAAASLLAAMLATLGLSLHEYGVRTQKERSFPPWHRKRAAILRDFDGKAGKHLVFVDRRPNRVGAVIQSYWVHNGADLDGAKVLWARDLTGRENEALTKRFQSRKLWLLRPYGEPPRLEPYPPQALPPPNPPGE